eukprot:Platyproteum_vivax@DN7435_c5_g10_i2.p1
MEISMIVGSLRHLTERLGALRLKSICHPLLFGKTGLCLNDSTVWQWNLRTNAAPNVKSELHLIGDIIFDKFSGKNESCAFQNGSCFYYLAESGTLYCSWKPDMLKQSYLFTFPELQNLYVAEKDTVSFSIHSEFLEYMFFEHREGDW